MTPTDLRYHATWKASSGHKSGRWRVTRQFFHPLPNPRFEQLHNKRGQPILFKTRETAQRRADKLNEAGRLHPRKF